nr:hypothetical protein [Pseudomonas sp. BIGb0427]
MPDLIEDAADGGIGLSLRLCCHCLSCSCLTWMSARTSSSWRRRSRALFSISTVMPLSWTIRVHWVISAAAMIARTSLNSWLRAIDALLSSFCRQLSGGASNIRRRAKKSRTPCSIKASSKAMLWLW